MPGARTRRAEVPRGSVAAARVTKRGVGAGVRAGGSARLGPARPAAGLRGVADGGAAAGPGRAAVVVRPKATCRTGPAVQQARCCRTMLVVLRVNSLLSNHAGSYQGKTGYCCVSMLTMTSLPQAKQTQDVRPCHVCDH